MENSDSARKSDSGSDGAAASGAQGDGAGTTRRKLNDQQEREVTRLYAETETPVSEISKRFGAVQANDHHFLIGEHRFEIFGDMTAVPCQRPQQSHERLGIDLTLHRPAARAERRVTATE